jgi:ribonuclease HI
MGGVYCAIPHSDYGLQLWYLDESCSQMKWVLKHNTNLESFGRKFHPDEYCGQPTDKHWILQDVNYRRCSSFAYYRKADVNYQAPAEEKYDWNSDDDNILDTEHPVQEIRWPEYIHFLGFHPNKETVFLAVASEGAVAYDWNSSKFHYLGRISPKHFELSEMEGASLDTYFPYTPCWMYEFPRTSSEYLLDDEQLSGVKARWKKPAQGVFKINVDASFREEEMQGATGLVVRDHVGSLISAQALWYAHAASPMIMKAIAIRDAVKLATERGYHWVEIESDAQQVVKLMKEPEIGGSEIASITREVKELSDFFTGFSIAYVCRTANEAAHRCANRASPERRRCLWINYKPQFLIDILEHDCCEGFKWITLPFSSI